MSERMESLLGNLLSQHAMGNQMSVQMLEEQRRTNELLVMLIDALAESEGDEDAEPTHYMDGARV